MSARGQGDYRCRGVASPDGLYFLVSSPALGEQAAASAAEALLVERPFGPRLPAVPDEEIPLNNGATIRPQLYGARTYGDLMVDRQTLSMVRLCRTITELGAELTDSHGLSDEYARALVGYAAATLVRLLRYSTRAAPADATRRQPSGRLPPSRKNAR